MGQKTSSLEKYFSRFRKNIIGEGQIFSTPYGKKRIVYADWTASGRLYKPLEEKIAKKFGPFVGNTHTESTVTGITTTQSYEEAKDIIKKHVGADKDDVLIPVGSGMTSAINKFQRILGLRIPEPFNKFIKIPEEHRPVVFVTHMEHHSNHTSWLETIADVVVISPTKDGLVDVAHLENLLKNYAHRKIKIAAITACSNVTGIQAPYHEIAKIMHEHHGWCFVDFAASAPYVDINMHPKNKSESLDAIYFSPHKFLGGPGSAGILIFNSNLYHNQVPDHPGGGTVKWTNPWGGRAYFDEIEIREGGGTPPFLQTIRAALTIKLKEQMGVAKMLKREEEIKEIIFEELRETENIHILARPVTRRLGIFSFIIRGAHYNLVSKLLNDRFGIQARGGCACAGTYGHYLFNINPAQSKKITDQIDHCDLSAKPGFVRLSIHPTMTDKEIFYITSAIRSVSKNYQSWSKDYSYDKCTNEFNHKKTKNAYLKVNPLFDF
ncbi:MAG: aminotransferase class V-fold PLP-dependent enzyme [Patescibacteria group bacterium]